RIVFNRSARGECNMRAFETTAAGALLFQEADNCEVSNYFVPGQEFVAYTDANLEELLEYYLIHEEERRAIAEAARDKVQAYGYEALWGTALARVAEELPRLRERHAQPGGETIGSFAANGGALTTDATRIDTGLMRRIWQALHVGGFEDTQLLA